MEKTAMAFALALGALAAFGTNEALAQSAKAGAAQAGKAAPTLKIKQITKPGNSCLVPSPDFDGKVKSPGRSSGPKKRWAALEAEYTTTADWTDAITFTFHVMSMDDEKTYHYYTATVTYVDVAKGDHGACVMLPPTAVLRYGTPMAFGVEVELDGKTVAKESEAPGSGKGKPWWEMLDAMAGKGKLERHSGLLQDRSKTPFGLTFIDQYEAVR
jgi:hypothetical protein